MCVLLDFSISPGSENQLHWLMFRETVERSNSKQTVSLFEQFKESEPEVLVVKVSNVPRTLVGIPSLLWCSENRQDRFF